MKQYYRLVFCLIVITLFVGCQSAARFNSSKHGSSGRSAIAKNNHNEEQNDILPKQDVSKYYDSPAKIIYPKAMMNNRSAKIVSIAEKWLGVNYRYGGNTRTGIDCSGFVKNVFKEIGVVLPRTSAEQFTFLKPTSTPFVGDLVFFRTNGRINHVGIFLGDDKIIHASSGKGVIIQKLKGTSLEKKFAGYRKAI